MVTRGYTQAFRNHIVSSDKCQGIRLRNTAKIYSGEKQVLGMLSSYPGSSRIAFKYHIDCLLGLQLHPDGMKLKHRTLGVPGRLGAVAWRVAVGRSFLARLVLETGIFVHPVQLLDATSLVGQLEVVITHVQTGKKEASIERTQLWHVLLSSTP